MASFREGGFCNEPLLVGNSSSPYASRSDGIFLREISWAAGEQFEPQMPFEGTREKGVQLYLMADSIIRREQQSRRQVQELYGSLEGEQRRIGAYGAVQYLLVVRLEEEP